jgi:hypothetical protein
MDKQKKDEFRAFIKNRKPITSFHFGDYKDIPFEEVPTWYLEWWINNGQGTRELYITVEQIYWGRLEGVIPRPAADFNRKDRFR